MAELWEAGISPKRVEHVHHAIWPDGPPLPVRLYLSAVYLLPDLRWLALVAKERPDPDILTWAAWTVSPLDRQRPQARLQWLSLGASMRDVSRLMRSGYLADDAHAYAAQSHITLPRAAAVLAAWLRADCCPGPGDLIALDLATGGGQSVPSGGAIDLLLQDVTGLRPRPTRTQAGLMLAIAGTRPSAARLLREGIRDAVTAARHVDVPLRLEA